MKQFAFLRFLNVCTPYLNSELKDVLYMWLSKGYADKTSAGKVLKPNKAIYG